MNNDYNKHWKKMRFLFLPLFIAGAFALSALVMVLWNWLMPALFNLGSISIWQAGGLFILCRVLFGGFGFKGGRGRKYGGPPAFKEKFMNMNEEEKQAFKEQWKQRCG